MEKMGVFGRFISVPDAVEQFLRPQNEGTETKALLPRCILTWQLATTNRFPIAQGLTFYKLAIVYMLQQVQSFYPRPR